MFFKLSSSIIIIITTTTYLIIEGTTSTTNWTRGTTNDAGLIINPLQEWQTSM